MGHDMTRKDTTVKRAGESVEKRSASIRALIRPSTLTKLRRMAQSEDRTVSLLVARILERAVDDEH
jgi:hypothetical protein